MKGISKKTFQTIVLFMKVALNYVKLTIAEKIQKAKNIVAMMTGNPAYPLPDPKLEDVTAAITALELSYEAALDGGKTKKQQMYADEAALDDYINRLGGYVQTASEGDELTILSSGMDVKKKPTPAGLLPVPENMKAKTGALEGTIDFAWKSNAKANGYILEYTEDPLGSTAWVKVEGITKAKYTLQGLVSGKKYWGRVSVFNTAGITNPSDPAVGRAL
ncbi:MAG: fibronectin type III domain-containing protein [Chitinophagales bacterium]